MKKQKQLGMNPSTASGRLVKDILFKLICDSNLNKCYHCGKEMARDNFSIEHKIPWLDSEDPLKLYFDLDNISFSHLSCNIQSSRYYTDDCKIGHNKRGLKKRIKSPKGFAWCNSCKKHLLIENFTENKSRWNGLQRQCIECRKKRNIK